MASKVSEFIRRNVVSAFIVVTLPVIVALAALLYFIIRINFSSLWYAFAGLLVALVIEYPYLKFCDRYFFK
jgi:hypothetical protein